MLNNIANILPSSNPKKAMSSSTHDSLPSLLKTFDKTSPKNTHTCFHVAHKNKYAPYRTKNKFAQ